MSTQAYYKDRLGFDPNESMNGELDKTQQGYEENLSKFKDERDAIQKKTFTKWVNKHLKKANRHVNDLFIDLQDGLNLISLLEVLSGEQLPREKGRLRFHMLQNVQMALDFLRYKKIKLVNIRAEDIVDGNPKLTLGLIWTIILHFQISDIVVGEESNVSAKDALLKWARRSTAKYPGVRVSDFTSSWKDGLAFNAIIHRNRPDLIDWRNIRNRVVRERLETAFHIAEREYGVTRLLDPEDVDTHEIDEKSIITYISSLYDVFPEPPLVHPLYDSESQQKISEYRDVASSLHLWIREKTSLMSDRNFPSTLIEMKKIAHESSRFRTEEVPSRHRDKQRLQHIYRDLQKYFESVGEVDIEPELHIDVIERNWNRLMMAHQERDQTIHEEIKRLERLQRLAEKVHREIKRIDTRLEDLESKIKEEARRLERLHPLDAKHNVDLLEQELHIIEESIQSLFSDVESLRDGRYPQASDLHKRVEKLHQRWLSLRSLLHSRLISPLSSISFPYVEEHTVSRQTRTILETRLADTNPYFKNLEECIEWCTKKLKQMQEAEYGSDLPGVQAELNSHLREHNSIEQFHTRCEQCINAKSNFHGDELALYTQNLNILQKLYTELLSTSNKRLSDLETLQDFLQSASNHLVWLNEKEEIELTRDWSDRDLNLSSIQQYYHSLMSELDKREIQFSAVQDRGESLLLQNHPASKCIENYMTAMNSQWSWILQLTLALETHLKHASYYQQFYKDVKEAEAWLNKRDELLNTVYSQSEFTLDEGERLLKGMQELREELNQYGEVVQSLAEQAQNVVPLKQRRQPVTRPIPILSVCSYKQNNINIEKGEQWILHDNSGRIKWRVSNGASGSDCNIPGVVFLIPPPDKEALEAIDRLKRQFERSIALWQRKQLRMRQNMIFSTIKVVKSWDLAQFLAMGADQRNAIRKALNEDAAKLLEEGDPADPQLRRLRREMDEVNRLFDEFERRAREEEENKNAIRMFNEQILAVQTTLDELEHTLNTRLNSPIPRDIDSLEHLVIQHKEFESRLRNLTSDIDAVQDTFKSISRKTPALQAKLDKILNQWNNLWSLSNLYVERMKCVEIVLNGLNETNHLLSDLEIKLASFREMPSELEALKSVHKDLLTLQNTVTRKQSVIDQLLEDGHNTRRLVEKSRHHIHTSIHHDLDRLDSDLNKVSVRWNNICSQLVDRLRSCEAAYDLLEKFADSYRVEAEIIEESYQKLNAIPPKSQAVEQIEPTKNLFKKVMERVPAVEQVNIDGGKFIREAKIYDLRLLHYCDWLIDEIHPSLEASIPNKKKIRLEHISGSGEAAVSHDLDVMNTRFDALINVLYDRMKQMVALYPEDQNLTEFIKKMEPKPLKTFRTEFSIYEQSPVITSISPTEKLSNGITWPNYTSSSTWDVVDTHISLKTNYDIDNIIKENFITESQNNMGNKTSLPLNGNSNIEATQFTEIRSLRRIHLMDEGVGTDSYDILAMKGIVHPETKEILTVEDAIRLRILDVRTGKIAVNPKSKSTYISIEEAVQRKLIIPELAEKLLGPCGITQDGKASLSLLEAIQRELIDAERGPMERLKVNLIDELGTSSIADMLVNQVPNLNKPTTIVPILGTQDYCLISRTKSSTLNLPLTLYDLLGLDLIERNTGLIFDRDTGRRCTIDEAIEKHILDPNTREIVDAVADNKITLKEALNRNLIKNGKYFHGLSNEKITFHEAKRRRLIIKPLSLKDCVDYEVLGENRLFKSPTYRCDLELTEAIKRAVIDFNTYRTVLNTSDGNLMTLSDAMNDNIINSDLLYINKSNKEMLFPKEAVDKGFLYSVSIKSIFDLAMFLKDTTRYEYISFNEAVGENLIKYENNITYYKHNSGELISLSEAVQKGYVRTNILEMLNKKIGIIKDKKELTVLEAAITGFIDSKSGLIIDQTTNIEIPFCEAIKRNLITEEGVVTLKSLLAITLSTQSITKTVLTYATSVCLLPTFREISSLSVSPCSMIPHEEIHKIEISEKSSFKKKIIQMLKPLNMKEETTDRLIVKEQFDIPAEGWDLQVAIEKNLFDPMSGLFIIPGTDRQVSFEECIKLEIINPKSALVVEPNKGKKITLKKSLKKQILDCTGHYCITVGTNIENPVKISMMEAITKSLVCFQTHREQQISLLSQPMERTIKSIVAHDHKITNMNMKNLKPIRILPNIIFDPESMLVIFVDNNSSDEICQAVLTGKINPSEIKIKIFPEVESDLHTVMQKGFIDLEARVYRDTKGENINLNDAIKAGIVSMLEYPLIATKSIIEDLTEPDTDNKLNIEMLSDDDEDNSGPSLAELTRTRITTEPKYLVSIGKAKSIEKNPNEGRLVLLQKMRKKKMKPKDVVPIGIIDENTANVLENLQYFKDAQGKQLNWFEALDLTQTFDNAKVIKDPFTRIMISIKEAIDRGILDRSSSTVELFVPVVRSLSLPDLLKQGLIENGMIIHPETGSDLYLNEAIACDIADPFSKIRDPSTGNVITLKDAMNIGLIGKNLEIKNGECGDLNVATATEKGNIFIEESESQLRLPPVAMTLDIATKNGLYDASTNSIRRPLTNEQIPLDVAIKESLIMTLSENENLQNAEVVLVESYSSRLVEVCDFNDLHPDTVIYNKINNSSCTLHETMEVDSINAKTGKLKDESDDDGITFKNVIKKGVLNVVGGSIAAGLVVSETCEKINKLPIDTIMLTKHLNAEYLSRKGIYDIEKKQFLDPESKLEISFKDLILSKRLFRVDRIYVKDLLQFDSYIPIQTALTLGVIDDHGFITNPNTNKKISFLESVKLGWITELESETVVENATPEMPFLRIKNSEKIHLDSKQRLDFESLLKSTDAVLVRYSNESDDIISLKEANDFGIVDLNAGILYCNTGESYDLATAFQKGLIFPYRIPISLVAAVRNGYYDKTENGILDEAVKQYIPLEEALKRRIINSSLTDCKDMKNNEFIPLKHAMCTKLIDDNCCLINTLSGEPIKLDVAVNQQLIVNRPFTLNLINAVTEKYYDPKTKKIFNSCTGEFQSVQEAVNSQFLDISKIKIKDIKQNEYLSIYTAISNGFIDLNRGLILIPVEMTLDIAVKKHFIISEMSSSCSDFNNILISKNILTNELQNYLECDTSSDVSKQADEILIYQQTTSENTFNANKLTTPCNSSTSTEIINLSTLKETHPKLFSFKEAIDKGLFNETTSLFFDSSTAENISLEKAIQRNLLCPYSILITDTVSNDKLHRKLNLIEALNMNIINGQNANVRKKSSGMITEISLSKAYEEGLVLDVKKMMPLQTAIHLGFYDDKEGKIIDPNSKKKLTLRETIERRIINAKSPCYWDEKFEKLLTLQECINDNIINADNCTFRVSTSNQFLNLVDALNYGYIVKIEQMGLHEAASFGFFNLGLFTHPESGCKLTLREAIVNNFIDPTSSLIKCSEQNTFIELLPSIKLKLIDDIGGYYVIPDTKEKIFLTEARKRSYIIPNLNKLSSHSIITNNNENSDVHTSYAELTFSMKPKLSAPISNEEYTLDESCKFEFLNLETAVMKNSLTHTFVNLKMLIEVGEIDLKTKIKFVPTNNINLPSRKAICNQGLIYTKKPMSILDAITRKCLNTTNCLFTDEETAITINLKEALNIGCIDHDSALVKDFTNKHLLTLTESFNKGLFDCDKNNIVDTQSSRLYNLSDALKINLIITDGLSLLDALDFGLYNPFTGLFIDPFHAAMERTLSHSNFNYKHDLTLEQSVKLHIINSSSVLIKDTEGNILTYQQALNKCILDPVLGQFFESHRKQSIDLLTARNRRYILSILSRQAMEEKYRLCDDTLSDLLSWISEVEDRIANQDVVQEDINQLRNQINILKLLKEEIDSQTRSITNSLDQVRQIVATGSEYLSRDEINNLEKKAKQLRMRYDRANERTDKLLRRLLAARDELTKFKNDLTIFTTWMEKAQRILEEKERSLSNLNRIDGSLEAVRDFVSDVIAHQADLRFITMAAQKFVDESKEYLTYLNEFRTSLPQRLPHIEPVSAQDSIVRNTVANVSSQYRDLLARVNALSDKLSGLGSKQKEYRDALNAAKAWLREVEPRVHKLLVEPVATDPTALEDQLSRVKALNNELVSQSRLIDSAKQALEALLRSVTDQLSPTDVANLKNPVTELDNKYRQLCDALAEKCRTLDTALVQSQGVQDALDGLLHWLNDTENTLKNITRPASLYKDRLEDQMREHRMLQADIDSHKASVDSVTQSAKELINTASNPRLAKKIETKLRDVISRYEKLLDKTIKRGDLLAQIYHSLTVFNDQASSLERWLGEALEIIPEASNNKIEDLIAQRDTLKQTLDQVIQDGKTLINHKDVTDTAYLRDRIKALELLWKDLLQLLDEKHRNSKLRVEQLNAYEKLRDQVLHWLTNMENKLNRLEPVAIEVESIKKQIEELKPIVKDHKEYGITIDKINDLGNAFDSLNRPETPTRRRNTASPTKRITLNAPSYGRRGSQDSIPSPSRGIGYLTQSPGGSSGFGSRRSSQDGFLLDESSEVQQQLTEINNRYNLLGVRLLDRQSELDSIKEELRKHLEHLKSLSQFLDKIQRLLPKENIPQTKEEADKMIKNIKGILEEIYEKQALLESTKAGINDLLRRKPTAYGFNILHNELQDICSRWKDLNDLCKERIQILEDLKDFHDTHDNLLNWLNAKDRMMTVLGPISSDSRMVQSQVQQVQVLREEFRTQQPQLNHFINIGENILSRIPDRKSPDAQKISTKLSNIQKKWNDLLARLDDRAESLGAAVDTSREFDAGLMRLRDALQNISDQLDDIPHDKEPDEQLRKIQTLERQLEGQRPLLADLEAAGAQLCEVLSDPTSRAEIQGKLSAVNRQYNNLQKKLDNRKAEIESLLRDGRQFESTCARSLGWLGETLGSIPERLLISADKDILQQQVDQHEPIYKEVMNKEHEIIMLLNKGKDLLSRSNQHNRADTRHLQKDIDKIQHLWDKLRRDAVDRQTRLQTCMEHCKKYYRALEAFIPWLSQAENKLDSLKPDTFKRTDVEKQLRELSLFRNDVWKHSGEFENLKTLGETFLAACDVDKELVKQELAAVKARWDKLNNELLERTQWLEDTARRLADFSENLRDITHSVQRCEDKLASHDALGGASRDPKMLERIKNLREEAVGLRKPLQSIGQTAKDLVAEAAVLGVGNASHLLDEVDSVTERLNDLVAKLDDRCSQLQSASTALAQYNEKIKGLCLNLSALEQELDSMKPVGRDIKTVRSQLDDVNKFIKKIVNINDDVQRAAEAGEHLVDAGFSVDSAVTRDQTEALIRQLNKLDERARNRENELETVLDKLQEFQRNHSTVLDDIIQAGEELRRLKPVGSEVEAIKSQQEEFLNFRKVMIEPLSQSIDNVNKLGQGLIQSAAGGVNTSGLEKDLEKMNDKWNALKDKLNERDRKLDVGLLQSGKFQEALAGLAKWLTDTEEMVANQKPPSADYKVVKAQLQEQKFLKKMLLDRQNSMASLFAMGNEVAAGADPNERKAIERQLRDLMQRFDNLTEGASERMDALEQAMIVAKEFQDKLVPILEWLDTTEKKIKEMELIPTDEEKIQQRIKEHDALHKDILRKKPALTELTEVASALMALVGEEEATGVADKLQDTADRYTALVDASDNVGQLLQASRAGLRHLVLTYQDLQAWMESMDNRLNRYKIMPVHTEKLLRHMEDLADVTEEIANRQMDVDSTVDSGLELMKHISNDEAIQLKDKLDSLQRRYRDLVSRGADLLKTAQEMLPLVQQFHNSHNRLVDWMMDAESQLQVAEPREDEIARLELDIQEFRPVLENINLIGPQLCQISPGEGAATIEGLVTRDNRRFDAIAQQIQRKAERINLSKQRSLEVIGDIDELLDWFREVENQLRDAEPPSAEPDVIRLQLKEHKALNDDISSQKSRVRDVLSTAKKVLRESVHSEEITTIREKMEDLKDIMDIVSKLSSDRLGVLEQALPLAEHFHQSHADLSSWLDDMERQVAMLAMPALRPDLIAQQQDKNEMFVQSINEHKPLIEKLNKTGEALIRLCNPEEGQKVQDIMDSDNARYAALRLELRQRQQALEKALQETSKFSDKLEGMLRALQNTAEQVSGADPISAHPPRIRDQIDENAALIEDLDKREEAFLAVKKAANDVINKAPNASDPAVKDMKRKLEKLNNLWNDVQKATSDRGRSLEEALELAEKFWDELQAIMATLRDLQDSLNSQEPPAVQPEAIHQQQVALQEIKAEIDQTKPEVEQCRVSGQQLMKVCGEPDKPEVKKHIEDLDNAWDTITALFAKREENLINAMEKAMEFHETLQAILDFLDTAENKFAKLGPLGTDIDAVKRQIAQLKQFKLEVDPHMVKVEALNRQAQELTERTSVEQAAALKEPLTNVNRRWDELLRGIVERQRQLENALLRLGQFQHALAELLTWIDATNKTLDNELKPVAGDPQLLEIELAKLKVLVNDIQAHQSSVDTLNDAGRQIIESGKGTDEASATQDKLVTLNRKWRDLLQKAADRQLELEEALRDAQRFAAEIQDLLSWLGEVDGIIAASKPVGGLPETASEQLERFMEVYNELEENRPKVETVLLQGQEYLKKSPHTGASNLQHNLKTLKQRWDNVTARANDKKIKLEIALKEATEFHDALQAFIDWLTNAEKVLTNLKPVSRVLATILTQIEEHKAFQKDVSAHREAMLHLDKKGTHLKYFSQKQDVILIKNLLISVQHRWERVVAKSAERTRALDHGYKEAREFHDAWTNLMNWLSETEKGLDELAVEASSIGNAPEKIKQRLAKHREFQRALSGKQATYDLTMRMGKALKEKAPKTDEPHLKQMMAELKEKWNTVCSKSVDRQRKLEEALLYCGQFKDALEALLEWLKKTEKELSEDGPVHGDLDTVTALIDQHKAFEQDFFNRTSQLESVKETANELIKKANPEDAALLKSQLNEIDSLWNRTSKLSERKSNRLKDALKDAEELHRSVHMLLEWLSDAEMKLRFAATLPEDDQETRNQLSEHEKFMRELAEKEYEKDTTINLAQRILQKAHPDAVSVIKHWITIIQSRWDEVSTWAKQREQKLRDHLRSLQDLDSLLEELLAWLQRLENQLLVLEAEPLPDNISEVEKLIEEHKEFMETTSQRQHDIDTVCKAKQAPLVADRKQIIGKRTANLRTSRDNLLQDKHGSRINLGLKEKADNLPHIGPRFPPKDSKGSEPTFRNARCKQLYDKWRNVWLLAWERQRRLQERLDYLKEVEKVRNFSWDDWRKRFLKFMNHKKSRLTDLFRKMDKNNDGLIPRDDFIDGIMKTKFGTSKLEMNAVADMFDHDGAGLIDWKEFIAALRPDWEEKPPSEAEKIHDEVKRLVMLCTCRQKFRVFQVGEGKYRFGDSQKLRLVRILRSTVMVRVGGGWVALDEFLIKNDPCRAKGRTNIELREQFILADGVSQSMSAFKPKHSAATEKQKSVSLSSNTGPITKIRERTTRSVPLGKTVNRNIGTPDSLSDTESSPYARTPIRKAATPTFKGGSLPGSRGNSRPASRQGSKPPSRHGSNLSLDSTDDGTPSRIPRRSISSAKSNNLSSRKPLWNESLSSHTRSPSGLASPVSDNRSDSVIHRASSIPTLSGTSSSSRIPIYVGPSSSDTSQQISVSSSSSGRTSNLPTPSSSHIPQSLRFKTSVGNSTPVSSGTRLTRKSSAASDSSRKSSKTPTPTDLRAPFRL